MRLDDTVNHFGAIWTQAKEGFFAALPNLLTALVVLAVGWGLAWALRRLMLGIFGRLGARLHDQKAASVAAGGVYWLILLATVAAAIDALDLPILRRWMEVARIHFPRVLMALVFIVGGVVLGRVASTAIVSTGFRLPPPQVRRLALLTRVAIVVTATLIAATQLGLDVSLVTSFILIAWAAALGAAALAFALGARETISNILAMHYVVQSFQIGQRVRIGSDEGRIVRTTRTAVYLENAEGELLIPGRDFADSRCVLLSVEGPRES